MRGALWWRRRVPLAERPSRGSRMSRRDGGRLLCIGDVHGCAAELEVLLRAIAPAQADRLVFLGDYVDRGTESRATLDLLLELREKLPRAVFLRGNHEEMMLAY